MRPPIAVRCSLDHTFKTKALFKEAGQPWISCYSSTLYIVMGDLDDIQLQPLLQNIPDDTVVPLGTENQANLQNHRVRITNNREWSEDQKHTRVETEYQERRKENNFMKCIKRRSNLKFPK